LLREVAVVCGFSPTDATLPPPVLGMPLA